jgi:hypothetical protein
MSTELNTARNRCQALFAINRYLISDATFLIRSSGLQSLFLDVEEPGLELGQAWCHRNPHPSRDRIEMNYSFLSTG